MKSEFSLQKQRGRVGIAFHLFLGFILFTAIIVALLWLFQVVFLNSFYKTIKLSSIDRRAHQIVLSLDDDARMLEVVQDAVDDEQMNVLVADGRGRRLAVGLSSSNDVFSELQSWELLALYIDTQRSGGSLYQRYVHGAENNPNDKFGIVTSAENVESVLYVYALQNEMEQERLVVIYASIEPVESTVQTLRVQLVVITGIMVLLSVLIALITAMIIARPIVRMNRSAALLSRGDYNVRFEENGARETAELAHSLNIAALELSKVDMLRKDLLANVSHDLRTPLTMITGYAEVMRDLPGENTPENVQIIIDEATRLTTLVNDLLDISKMQSGTIVLSRSRFSLTHCIREILRRYDRLIDYHFVFENTQDVVVDADEVKITQVIYNLVNNAVTYTGEDKSITLRQVVSGSRVRVEVIDTGEGIPEDKLQDIWERYYKVDKQHKRAQVGTGLGLFIVKTVMDLHNGTCGVQSKLGEGSTFWFELPLPEENS